MVVDIDLLGPQETDPATGQVNSAGNSALVRMKQISQNIVTPAHLLRRLSASSDTELRMAVADHKNTPLGVLFVLAEDENPDVRFALAENHNISPDVLKKLSNDTNPYVAHRAKKTLSRLSDDVILFARAGAHAYNRG